MLDRVTAKIVVDGSDPLGGCWAWDGKHTQGYARIEFGKGGRHGRGAAHRYLYEHVFGPIPDDLVLDHLCRNPGCVNPRHLEPVSNHENILRGVVPSANRAICKNGLHDITTPGSIYVDSEGTERCRECRLESKRRYNRKRALAAA